MTVPSRLQRRLVALLLLGLVATLVPLTRTASPARAAVPTVQTVVIDGRGNGHGGGLSQWGALGWATVYGKTWQEILALYYSDTALAPVTAGDFRNTPVGRINVQLSRLDGLQTAVISESGSLSVSADPNDERWSSLMAREIPGRDNVYEIWGRKTVLCPVLADSGTPVDDDTSDDPAITSTTADPASTTASTLTPSSDPSTTAASASTTPADPGSTTTAPAAPSKQWVRVATEVTGPVVFLVDKVDQPDAVSPRDVIGVCLRNRSVKYYRGTISAVNNPVTGRNYTFNSVLLDEYVRGVVPRETPASWAKAGGGKGINALRAQAVAARSYAVAARPRSSGAKICDTSSCQVYGGTGARKTTRSRYFSLENPAATAAVADTAGIVLRYTSGNVALAVYSSSNGGRSIASLYRAVDDPGDAIIANPHHEWSRSFDAAVIEKAWPQIGSLVNITVTRRTGGGVWDGWVDRLTVEGTKASVSMSGDQFRRALKLKSRYLNFTLVRTPDKTAVGPGLFIGDSVALGAAKELRSMVGAAYSMDFQLKAGRCLLDAPTGPCKQNSLTSLLAKASTPAYAVIALGYEQAATLTIEQINAVMEQFLARGVARVLWINLTDRRHNADGTSTFAPANEALATADAAWDQLTVLDWNAAMLADTAGRWLEKGSSTAPDLANLTASGRTRFALFVRTQLDALRAQGSLPAEVSTTPITTTTTTLDPLAPTTEPVTSTTITGITVSTIPVTPVSSTVVTPPPTAATSTVASTVASSKPLGVLRFGMRGGQVRLLQSRLVALGYPLKVDGHFGKATRKYVREFQRKMNLTPDGVVGRRTWAALGA